MEIIIIFILSLIVIYLSFTINKLKTHPSKKPTEAQQNLFTYFNYLLKYSNYIVIITDSKLKIIDVNEQALEMYGYTKEEFLKLTIQDLRTTDSISDIERQYKIINSSGSLKFGSKHRRKDGSIFPVEISTYLIELNNTKYYKNVVIDITEREKLEHQIISEKNQLRTIIDASPASIWFKDTKNNFIRVNEAAAKIASKTVNEIEGRSTKEIFPIEADKYYADDLEVINTGKPKLGIIESVTTETEVRWVRTDKIPWINNEGKIAGIIAFALDITDYLHSVERIKILAHAIRSVSESISITDMKDKIIFVNEAFTKTYGYTEKELIGNNISIIRPKNFSMETNDILNGTMKGGWKGEIINRKKDGTEFPIYLSTSVIKDENDNPVALIGVASDATEAKKSRDELIKAKEKAEELNRLKSSFLANMSHELRTPMIGILGFSEILREEIEDEQQRDMIDTIITSSNRLMNTLNLLLDLSRIESNIQDLNLNEINISKNVESIVNTFKGAANRKNLSLTLVKKDEKVTSQLDSRAFEGIINNLLNNAIKFTPKGGIEVFVLSELIDNKPFAVIKVKDTGIGIPKESQQIIFEEFRQVSEGLNRLYDGTGLGLTITKRTIELMNGKISVESNEGIGSTFTVSFPATSKIVIQDHHIEKETSPITVEEPDKELKILIVENDKTNRDFMFRVLKKYYTVDTAEDGKTAIEQATRNNYSIVFMDIGLGFGMNGMQAAVEIRKISGYENVPIVAVTAYAMQSEKELFLSQGLSHYLSKPFSKEDLLKLAEVILSGDKA